MRWGDSRADGVFYRGAVLERGDEIAELCGENILLDECGVRPGAPDDARPLIRDVSVHNLTLRNCDLVGAQLRNVTIDGLYVDEASKFVFANEFVNVKLMGPIDDVVLSIFHRNPELDRSYRRVLLDAEAEVDCTLDISEAEGEIIIRGYAVDKVRRDIETQAIVRLENVLSDEWCGIDYSDSGFDAGIAAMRSQGWSGVILVANKRSRRFKEYLRVIHRLRDAGVADYL